MGPVFESQGPRRRETRRWLFMERISSGIYLKRLPRP